MAKALATFTAKGKHTSTSTSVPGSKPEEPCCDSCAAGGECSEVCPGTPPAFTLPECYRGCKTISKCLMAFYRDARLRTDSAAWIEYNKREIPLVHINVSVGDAPTTRRRCRRSRPTPSTCSCRSGASGSRTSRASSRSTSTGAAAPRRTQRCRSASGPATTASAR
ncbi:hypothetical protein [Nannocystis pusilla]|uniref:hypothetical protein n=1 Tax=Nannocystis pusilla TaxID=889268 RepID=UPI003B7F2E59